jgi:hypothetical protein
MKKKKEKRESQWVTIGLLDWQKPRGTKNQTLK